MKTNISAVKQFQTCQLDWYYRYHLRRIPRAVPAPYLATGTVWHTAMAAIMRGATTDQAYIQFHQAINHFEDDWVHAKLGDPTGNIDKFLSEAARLGDLLRHWSPRFEWESVQMVETPIEINLGLTKHQLIGRPDAIVRLYNKYWHVQHRTLSDRTPITPYITTRARDLHELGYAWLIMQHFGISPDEYGGSYFNIVRKLSAKAISLNPQEAFVQELVPLRFDQICMAIRDITTICDQMAEIAAGRDPISNREADLNRFGNVLNPYWQVRLGITDINDDYHFMDSPDPYEESHGHSDSV